jgi:hypothetical protein
MRAVAWMLSLLLLLAPVGLAEEESSSSSSSSSSSTSGSPSSGPSPDCDDDEGEDGDKTCDPRANRTQPRPSDGCRDGEEDEDEAAHCERAVRRIGDERGRDWISFQVDAANATLLDYSISGLLALERLQLDLDDGNLSIERSGATLHVRDGDAELRLHDIPTGLIRFKGDDGNVTLQFPADAAVQRDEQGARIAYSGGREGHLVADNATWVDNFTVQLNGFFAFHVPARGDPADAEDPPEAIEAEERKDEAREHGRIGAEISLKPRPAQAEGAALAADDSVEILAYDDVDVVVDLPEQAEASEHAPLRVVVSSELDEGRTIVLNVDEDLLASTDPADLVLRYFDVYNQTDGSVFETEVVFAAAGSLQDVLEPMDDGGQPEFWIVEDANGVQVLVSVPHWSAHAITVASIATAFTAPNVAVGIVAGAAASLVMGVLLFLPRRRDDEL